jgi:hypothetical protein
MNYQAIYQNLIEKRTNNPATGYIERHHIVMSSMGGADAPNNIVLLTGREHWVAHQLLYKIHRNDKTAYACHMMAMRCEERGIPRIKNSRMYEVIRNAHAKFMSRVDRAGKRNSQYGSMWISNVKNKINSKVPKNQPIPKGWCKGRNKWTCHKTHTRKERDIETWKKRLSEAAKGKGKGHKRNCGKNNPMYGLSYKWATDGFVNKRVPVDEPIPDGYRLGKTQHKA